MALWSSLGKRLSRFEASCAALRIPAYSCVGTSCFAILNDAQCTLSFHASIRCCRAASSSCLGGGCVAAALRLGPKSGMLFRAGSGWSDM
eukprot:7386868-Prymnesium_polylepis.3